MLQSGFSIGSLGDFNIVENLYKEVNECVAKAQKLINAKKIEGKESTVILDQILAGVFVHEAFGHLSEADNVYENERLKNLLKLGTKFGNKDWVLLVNKRNHCLMWLHAKTILNIDGKFNKNHLKYYNESN